jgi:uncharacterized membrane protein YhaH (DUF805 family)
MKNLFSIKGLASRTEYFIIFLIYFLWLGFYLIRYSADFAEDEINFNGSILSFLILMILMILLTTASIRRLHDMGYSGWWQILVCLMPILIIGLILLPGENKTEFVVSNFIIRINKIFRLLAALLLCIFGPLLIYIVTLKIWELMLESNKLKVFIMMLSSPLILYPTSLLIGLLFEFSLKLSKSKMFGAIIISIVSFIANLFSLYIVWGTSKEYTGWIIFLSIFCTILLIAISISVAAGLVQQIQAHLEFKKRNNYDY